MQSTALLTDHYELTMLEASLHSGVARHRAVFEVFTRSLPAGRRYGVLCGGGRVSEAIEDFVFGPDELSALESAGVVRAETLEWLSGYRFAGSVDAYADGELFFAGSPVLTVEATFGEAVLLETLVLSILNFDSAVASAASRMVNAAGDRPIIEMGGRRTHERAAVAAARAAYIAGFASTSNLEAGRTYGVPTTGTAAHAFTLAHRDERAAFAAQLDAQGVDTTLLVDTFDIAEAIRTAVELARQRGADGPGAVRLDSGDLAVEAHRARLLLDELGARSTRIVVTSDLDEFSIAELRDAPIDGYGVGTRVVLGSGSPTVGFVYKLVAIADAPGEDASLRRVAKHSPGKESIGGRKVSWRELDPRGCAVAERVALAGDPEHGSALGVRRMLQTRLMEGGKRLSSETIADARAHHRTALAELPAGALEVAPGEPALEVLIGSAGG